MTLQGQVLGSPAYMAPEQAFGDVDDMDKRTDVYGLGGLLYTVLTLYPRRTPVCRWRTPSGNTIRACCRRRPPSTPAADSGFGRN